MKLRKKGFFRQNHWRFSRKVKCLIVFAIIAVLLISVFAFLPKQNVTKGNVVPQSSDNSTATSSPQSNGSLPSEVAGNFTGYVIPALKQTPGLIESAQTINSTVWMKVAANAWVYYQPGVGVDNNTGLPYATAYGFYAFTDWDLGVYIQAIIDAQELNLITPDGAWGSDARINDVLTFLENRTLNAAIGDYPWQFYDSETGGEYMSISTREHR